MRQYEFMVVFHPTAEITDKNAADVIGKLAGDGVKVSSAVIMGKKPLAYIIKKQTEGLYVSATLEGKNLHVHDIEKKVQLGTEVLRYLLTVK